MESPPIIDRPRGAGAVAAIPPQHLQSLLSASPGPGALFAYHHSGTRSTSNAVVRTRQSSFVRSTRSRQVAFSSPDARVRNAKDDERKPSARNIRTPQDFNSNLIETSLRLDTNLSAAALTSPTRPVSATVQGTPITSVIPMTRARKRRNVGTSSPSISKRRAIAKEGKPAALKSDPDDLSDAGSCCICMSDPEPGEAASIDGCNHKFCFNCIEKWSERENTCPLCKCRFKRIIRVQKGKKIKGKKGTKRVKQRDQRADLSPNSNLESLLANLQAGSARIENPLTQLIVSSLSSQNNLGLGIHRRNDRFRYRNPSQIEEVLFSDNEEGSDVEGGSFTSFVDSMRRMNHRRDVFNSYPAIHITPLRPVFPSVMPPAVPPRSYATNAHDVNAGGTADNALEIVDDSDDEVEVVDVIGRAV